MEIAAVFYNVILPPFLVFFFGFWMYVLQKRSNGSTAQDLKILIDEIQEERERLKKTNAANEAKVKEYESERKILIQGMADLKEQIKQLEKERDTDRQTFENDRQQWMTEKRALEATINSLREEMAQLKATTKKLETGELKAQKRNRDV